MGSTTTRRSLMSVAAVLCLIMMINSTPVQSLTAYEVLENYNLPAGLLPEGVVGYNLDTSTGEISVYLTGNCSFSVSSYQLKYDSTVKGYISNGKISSLEGVSVNFLSAWMSIEAILREDINLRFYVGITSAIFPAADFVTSPQCV